MRHRKLKYKIGTDPGHRKALLRNLARSLVQQERIVTTITRAKALRRVADRLITLAKRGDLHARRQVLKFITDKKVVAKLFTELAPHYVERNGGYTRILKLGNRRGDGAHMALIEWVGARERQAAARENEKENKQSLKKKKGLFKKALEQARVEATKDDNKTKASSSETTS